MNNDLMREMAEALRDWQRYEAGEGIDRRRLWQQRDKLLARAAAVQEEPGYVDRWGNRHWDATGTAPAVQDAGLLVPNLLATMAQIQRAYDAWNYAPEQDAPMMTDMMVTPESIGELPDTTPVQDVGEQVYSDMDNPDSWKGAAGEQEPWRFNENGVIYNRVTQKQPGLDEICARLNALERQPNAEAQKQLKSEMMDYAALNDTANELRQQVEVLQAELKGVLDRLTNSINRHNEEREALQARIAELDNQRLLAVIWLRSIPVAERRGVESELLAALTRDAGGR